jgi:hypothetical protein
MAFYNFEGDDALNFLNQETFDHNQVCQHGLIVCSNIQVDFEVRIQASGHGVVAAGLAGPPSNIGGWPPLSDIEWQQQQFDMAQMMYPVSEIVIVTPHTKAAGLPKVVTFSNRQHKPAPPWA